MDEFFGIDFFFFFESMMELIGESQLMWNIAKIRLWGSVQNMWEDQAGEWIYSFI